MSTGLFRKNSLDKVSSPEQVNDYIKTTNMSIWVIFIVVALLLIGVTVWGIFGTIDISVSGVAVCEDGSVTCYISENEIDRVSESSHIRVNDEDYEIAELSELPAPSENMLSPYALHLAGFDDSEWVYSASVKGDLPDGIYKAEIVIESISPVSLLMN